MQPETRQLADLTKPYDPRAVEGRTYAFWEDQGYFAPTIDASRPPFVVMIPPPNVTGALHTGHALTFTIEDILVRWHRMMGDPTLWLPGTDHAAIATEYLLVRSLRNQGLTRNGLGRDEYLKRAWAWTDETHGVITNQMRRLGMSVDWSRERFTMDDGLSLAVRTAFVRLYEEGLIYRGDYMGNWCPGCQTVISDLEVEHRDEEGHLWHLRYPLADNPSQSVIVATTRPETMLGDTAVAVHPDDERYKSLIGQTLLLPIMDRRLPVIADSAVDPAFGTGAVKVTPAHDPTDYEIGRRHDLPLIDVMNPDGTMSHHAGKFAGLDRFEARRDVLAELERLGALVKTEPYSHAVGHCQRSGDVVEPRTSLQWWVRMKGMAEAAKAAVEDERITIIPDRFTRVYTHWMDNIRDWAVSRQIWWGHRIPVWYCQNCDEVIVAIEPPATCPKCGTDDLLQEQDTLDTWFSSGLWPFSTLGWPNETEDLRYFYPGSVMETGYDILFFWVARMVMLGMHFMGDAPFRHIYLHGMVRDAFGQKMSKVKGNVINPLDLMDEYGTDALRIAVVTGNSAGNDLRLSEQRVEHGRNFANKLWNAARFVLTYAAPPGSGSPGLPERWIRSRTSAICAEVTRLLDNFQLGEAARRAEEFFWGDFCDWYMETVKERVLKGSGTDGRAAAAKQTLEDVLAVSARLLHPFMPYVTEEIWQHLRTRNHSQTETVAMAPWPTGGADADGWHDENAEAEMGLLIDAITAIRNYRSENKIEPAQRLDVAASSEVLQAHAYLLEALANVRLAPAVQAAVPLLIGSIQLLVSVPFDKAAEQARLSQELTDARSELERAERQLNQPGFRDRAPAEVVAKARERLASARQKAETLQQQLEALG
ncbi:MAG: valine--tRNA ligase [Chloroflexi bacterium]|nr:valine--tRNA ligase [Chloroflexota bacterium]